MFVTSSLSRALALPLAPARVKWINAMRVPVIMDTSRARRELRWRPRHSAQDVLEATARGARGRGLI